MTLEGLGAIIGLLLVIVLLRRVWLCIAAALRKSSEDATYAQLHERYAEGLIDESKSLHVSDVVHALVEEGHAPHDKAAEHHPELAHPSVRMIPSRATVAKAACGWITHGAASMLSRRVREPTVVVAPDPQSRIRAALRQVDSGYGGLTAPRRMAMGLMSGIRSTRGSTATGARSAYSRDIKPVVV